MNRIEGGTPPIRLHNSAQSFTLQTAELNDEEVYALVRIGGRIERVDIPPRSHPPCSSGHIPLGTVTIP